MFNDEISLSMIAKPNYYYIRISKKFENLELLYGWLLMMMTNTADAAYTKSI